MTKLISGRDLAAYIKQRQAGQVRSLIAQGVAPKLAIVVTVNHPAINVYMRMKQSYGSDLGNVIVDIHQIKQDDAPSVIAKLNNDKTVHGIIVQLPLERPDETEKIVNLVASEKDVDALGVQAQFDPATPLAILWLLAGYNIDLHTGKRVLLIGRGRLVGAPLERILSASGVDVHVADRGTTDLKAETIQADVIITATGSPAIIYPDMLKSGAVIIDAGVAGEEGKTVGDVAPEVYEREDLIITPQKGGVGPLTICALFENVIRSAGLQVSESQS